MQKFWQDSSFLNECKTKFGFELAAWVPLPQPVSFSFYANWIKDQRHAGMDYLEKQSPVKADLTKLWPDAKSLFVVGVRYKPHPEKIDPLPRGLKIANYAQGRDYHEWLSERLELLCRELSQKIADFSYLIATDSKPILERDLAAQAGLGWIGKNTCLIHPQEGSFFLIAEVLTNLELEEPQSIAPLPDFCGTCQRCLVACPTEALVSPRVLDARLCISYWTIEARDVPPANLREKMGDLFFGCDICQDVCPWNQKVFRHSPLSPPPPLTSAPDELRFFLTASNREIEKAWGHTPLLRARPRGLRRNALIVAANTRREDLTAEISRWKDDLELGELAHWALGQILRPPGLP